MTVVYSYYKQSLRTLYVCFALCDFFIESGTYNQVGTVIYLILLIHVQVCFEIQEIIFPSSIIAK